jgi:hypothetical protein
VRVGGLGATQEGSGLFAATREHCPWYLNCLSTVPKGGLAYHTSPTTSMTAV